MSAIVNVHTTTSQSTSNHSQYFLVTANGAITTSVSPAISTSGGGYGARVLVLGDVASSFTAMSLTGVDIGGRSLSEVVIGENASVATIGFSSSAIYAAGDRVSIANSGNVSAISTAVSINGSYANISNSGTMTGTEYAIFLDQDGGGASSQILNSGTLNGGVFNQNGTLSLNNSGTIQTSSTAVRISENGNFVLSLHNTGTISSTGYAVFSEGNGGSQIGIVNKGDILGIVSLTKNDDSIRNSGLISRNIDAKDGEDTVINHGVISRNVVLGDDNDIYRGTGRVEGTLEGGNGNDQFFLRAEDVSIEGGSGTDTLTAWRDVENVAGVENVTLRGSANLSARMAADGTSTTLKGNRGNNLLDAANGADTLIGGKGADTLIGRFGRDVLTGGAGADSFEFASTGDSGTTLATRDVITDFRRKTDVIDLRDMTPGKFDFLGGAQFTGTGDAELRVRKSGPNMLAVVDKNGDGTADFAVLVKDVAALSASDFLL